ncbi:MAG TPA: hypothetical protein VGM83_15750 [Devosiaceae bacterium]|jgi:hypothetical protein
MGRRLLARIGGILALTMALSGCIDARLNVDVLTDKTARATLTQTMAADFYAMIKADGDKGHRRFCKETGAVLTENHDGSATCVIVREGDFAGLVFGGAEGQQTMSFTPAGEGSIRVGFPTAELVKALSNNKQMDDQTRSMLLALFQDHNLTLVVDGGEIVESNMTIAADRHSATETVPFTDLLGGTAQLPQELYAVVKR